MQIAPHAPVELFGLSFNMMTLYMSWLVGAVLVFGGWMATRRMTEVPGRWQLAMELLVDFFDSLTQQALGERGRKYLPFVGTIFLFVWFSNMIGLVPGFHEPTKDLNTPLSLAVLAIATAHLSCIVVKGFRTWWWEFFEPAFPAEGLGGKIIAAVFGLITVGLYAWVASEVCAAVLPTASATGKAATFAVLGLLAAGIVFTAVLGFQKKQVPNLPMAPLNFVGEVGKSVSLPFRLYGNIFGGAVIFVVISWLIYSKFFLPVFVGIPLVIMVFFGLFVGAVQAFVFAMLSMTYISVALAEDEESDG